MNNELFRNFILLFLIPLYSVCYSQDLKWIYKIGGINADYGTGIAIDPDQNIYDISNFMGTVSVANGLNFVSRGQEDILIRRSSSLGILQWAKQIGGKGQDLSYDIATDNDKNIFIVGTFRDSLFFSNQMVLSGSADNQSSFIIKLSPDGNLLWAQKMTSNNAVNIRTITAGGPNDLVVSGSFEGSAIFNDQLTLSSNGGSDIFIMKMNGSTGQPNFIRKIGGSEQEYGTQHAVDNQNNIYVTGDFRQILDFDPGVGENLLNTKGLTDIFLLKLSSTGVFQWAKGYGGINVDYGQSLVCDKDRNIILTGRFSENVGFGSTSQAVQSKGSTDIFVVKVDGSGNTLWVNSYGDVDADQGSQVLVNQNGVIYIAGIFRKKVDFDPSFEFSSRSESKGGADVFIAVYNQDGSYNEHFSLGGIANELIGDFALRNNGELVSTGGFGAIVDFDPTSSDTNIFSSGGLDAFLINVFVCVNPYLKEVKAVKPEICLGENVLIQVVEGYLNNATQWSWQRDDCNGITFAAGNFLNIPVTKNTTFYLKGWGGCIINDPCKKIDIKVFTDSLRYQFLELCDGDTLKIGNNQYNSPGVYVDSLTSKSGCDSVIVTEIGIRPKYIATKSFSICPGDTVKVGTSKYTQSGTYTNRFSSINGCDSIIESTVTVLPITIENIESTICEGSSVTIGNTSYSIAGTYTQNRPAANGCNDVIKINIKVLKSDVFQSKQFCQGDSLRVGNKIYRTTGIYRDTLVSVFGCDSIITSNLKVLSISTLNATYSICDGDSIKVGNKYYKSSGNYIDVFSNSNGCDSIVNTVLRILTLPKPFFQEKNICQGENFKIGSKTYSSKGTFIDTLKTIFGCDSIVTTKINIFEKQFFTKAVICKGDSIKIGSAAFYNSGVYSIPLKNYFGCDSIISLDLNVNEVKATSFNYSICPGNTVKVGNKVYGIPGMYIDTLKTAKGCDSIITSKITFNHVSTSRNVTICKGDSFVFNFKTYKDEGTFRDTLRKSDGCDSIVIINVKVNPTFIKDTIFEICKGGSVTVGSSTYFNSGKFTEVLQSTIGCDSIIKFEIRVINFIPAVFASKDTLQAFVISGAKYQWYQCLNGERIPFLGAESPSFPLFKSGIYSLGITFKGCTFFSDCLDFIKSSLNDGGFNVLTVYPNPFAESFQVNIDSEALLTLRTMNGAIIYNCELHNGHNTINVTDIPGGVYLLEIANSTGYKNLKIIKL